MKPFNVAYGQQQQTTASTALLVNPPTVFMTPGMGTVLQHQVPDAAAQGYRSKSTEKTQNQRG